MFKRLKRFDWLVTLGCLVLLGYFAWHAFEGPRGYEHLANLAANVEKLEGELTVAMVAKAGLEGKVSLMRPESVDPDMLEELARSQLELARPNELIVRFTE